MLGVLRVILGHHAVAGRGSVTGQLQIALVNVRSRTADFNVGTIALKRSIGLKMPTAAAAAAASIAAAGFTATTALTLH
jgi:hypothetical protein